MGKGITVRVYETRRFMGSWSSDVLRDLTILCRQSYSRYGDRNLFDKYDDKSAIYVARVSYFVPGVYGQMYPVEEFLSARVVPGDVLPQGAGELEIYTHDGLRMDDVIRDRFIGGRDDFWHFIFASSRMCGIHPLYLNEKDERLNSPLSIKHQHSAYCYSLLNYQFLVDHPEPFWFMTGIISDNFVDNVLTINNNGRILKPHFTPAHTFLGVVKSKAPRLDRSAYAYKFPMYWLNVSQLLILLEELLKNGVLTENTFKYYLRTYLDFNQITRSRTSPELARLGDLLTVFGKLEGAEITGQELRQFIDRRVADEPELKITDSATWRKGLEDFVKYSDVVGISL